MHLPLPVWHETTTRLLSQAVPLAVTTPSRTLVPPMFCRLTCSSCYTMAWFWMMISIGHLLLLEFWSYVSFLLFFCFLELRIIICLFGFVSWPVYKKESIYACLDSYPLCLLTPFVSVCMPLSPKTSSHWKVAWSGIQSLSDCIYVAVLLFYFWNDLVCS
jgi:hypothetical protein